MPVSLAALLVTALSFVPLPQQGAGTAWPGLWGPSRTGAVDAELPSALAGVDVVWQRPTAGGYSEIAVANGLAVTMELAGADDFVVALDAASGREQWRVRVGPTYKGHGGSDDGPIATPAIDGNDVFALGPHGELIAIDAASGRERWRVNLVEEHGTQAPIWGFAASPLVDGTRVIVPTGGASSKGTIAFDRATGRPVWHTLAATVPAFSSAVLATIGGVRQIVGVSSDAVYGLSPDDGRLLWSAPGPGGGIIVSNSAVVLPGDLVLISNWDATSAVAVTKNGDTFSARELWKTPLLGRANGPTVYRDGHLYGFSGAVLLCLDVKTQQVKWRERTGAGTLIALGDRLVVLGDESGDVTVARASPEAFALLYRARVLTPGVRAVTGPSYANGLLFVRNLKEMRALRLRAN